MPLTCSAPRVRGTGLGLGRSPFFSRHLSERAVTWARQRQEFAELVATTRQATDNARSHVNDQYRRRWRQLYAAQRKEARHVARHDTHIFERAVYVFVNSERLGNGRPLPMKRKVQLILSQRKLDDALAACTGVSALASARCRKPTGTSSWNAPCVPMTRVSRR